MSDNERADHRTRFKKGQSGNPGGRPKGRKNDATAVREVLFKPMRVKDGNGSRTMPKIAVALEVCLNNAIKGESKNLFKLLELADKFGLLKDAVETDTPAFRSVTIKTVVVEPDGSKYSLPSTESIVRNK
ncbi:MAG: hypothetical protein JO004_09745 [Methylobacteriaceae bacterium]|nr:hypothetical protein [Methylobacteriaceae bacterium]